MRQLQTLHLMHTAIKLTSCCTVHHAFVCISFIDCTTNGSQNITHKLLAMSMSHWRSSHLTFKSNSLWAMCYDSHKINCDWCERIKMATLNSHLISILSDCCSQGVYIQWTDLFLPAFCCIFHDPKTSTTIL